MFERRLIACRSSRLVVAAVLLSISGAVSTAHAYTTVAGSAYGTGLSCESRADGSQANELEFDSRIEQSCSASAQDNSWNQATTFAAYARPGQLGVSATYGFVGNGNLGTSPGLYTGLSQVRAGVSESLTIVSGPQEGSIVFDIEVSGSTSTSITRFGPFGDARANIDGGLQTNPRNSNITEPTITLGENDSARNRVSIRVQYERGFAIFNMFLGASAGCTNVSRNEGNSCVANANAFNSATVMGGQVFDVNGVLVEGAVVTSESGFDYLAGYSEPEPDGDEDGTGDADDNCPVDFNADQADLDDDGFGDVCDEDDDGDGQSDIDELSCNSDPFDADVLADDVDGDGIVDCQDDDIALPLQCDIDEDRDVDISDIRAIFAARNTPAIGIDDPRDVDGDGVVTILDGRQCTRQCTYSRCAPGAP